MRRRLIPAGLAIAAPVGVALALPRVNPHLPHSLATVANLPTQIMTRGPGRPRGVFMDLPGAYSHEYFPRVSNDRRRLVWSAAASGHKRTPERTDRPDEGA